MPDTQVESTTEPVASTTGSSRWERAFLAAYLVAAGLLLMYLIVRLWPEVDANTNKWKQDVFVFWKEGPTTVPDEMRLLLLVFAAGGLGSFIHAATSFVDFVGNRRFVGSWTLWYILRPIIGSALATVLYVAVRGGLLTAGGGSNVSPFGVCSIAALAGMFSKQATDKLNEMFTTLFKTSTDGDAARKDKLDSALKVTGVTPNAPPKGADVDLTVNGAGFDPAAVARLNGQAKPTTFVSASRLTVKLTAADLNGAAPLLLVVHNPNGQASAPVTLTVS